MWLLFLSIGLLFSVLAAASAYLITYNEYIHHFPTAQQARKHSLQSALVAFIALLVLAVLSGFLLQELL